LIEHESAIVDAVLSAVQPLVSADDMLDLDDAVFKVVSSIGTGQLGAVLDWAKAKPVLTTTS